MQKSLFTRIFSLFAGIMLLSLSFLGTMFIIFTSQYYTREKQQLLYDSALTATALTMQNYQENGGTISSAVLQPAYGLLARTIDADLFVCDNTGRTLICSEGAACRHKTYLVSGEILAAVAGGIYRESERFGGVYDESHFTVGIPLVRDGVFLGAVFASSDVRTMSRFLLNLVFIFIIAAAAVLLLSFVAIYFTAYRMVRPLRQMAVASRQLAAGSFETRIRVRGSDEISELAVAFNNMAQALSDLERMRSSFVANVSHELKTPMTIIGGFVDGILDGTIGEDQQRHYLRIVSDEVKRLSRLVTSLLELAKFEAGEMQLQRVAVELAPVIQAAMFSFERAIEEKNLEVRGLDLPRAAVLADAVLLHQVVYNLLDNAVKFASPGGYLGVSLYHEGNKTYVAIQNSGEGIPKESIPFLFDRFYKQDASRGLDKRGVGLGLYIVRSIVKLLGGDIFVRSRPGEYSEFIFSLETARDKDRAKPGGRP